MAKRSKIVADERRREIVARYAERRAELKETIRTASTAEERSATLNVPVDLAPGSYRVVARCDQHPGRQVAPDRIDTDRTPLEYCSSRNRRPPRPGEGASPASPGGAPRAGSGTAQLVALDVGAGRGGP